MAKKLPSALKKFQFKKGSTRAAKAGRKSKPGTKKGVK